MSHTVVFATDIKNVEAIEVTCTRLKLSKPRPVEKYRMRSGKEVCGQSINLPGWRKPVVIDTTTGKVEFDNWSDYDENHPRVRSGEKQVGDNGRWGDIAELNRFVSECVGTQFMLKASQEQHRVQEFGWNAENETFRVLLQT
jgi:hypothetical protein